MISLAVLSSCSDSITSSLNSGSAENQISTSGSNKKGDSFSSSFKIKPGEHIFLHSGITGLNSITEYSISNCGITKNDLYISASNIDASQSLPCSSGNYILDDLLIENRSEKIRAVDVNLFGVSGK